MPPVQRILTARLHNERNVAVTYEKPQRLPMPNKAWCADYVFPRYASLRQIRDDAMRLYGLALDDFTTIRNEEWSTAARHYFFYHARVFASTSAGRKASLPRIAGEVHRSHHATVLYGASRHATAFGLNTYWSMQKRHTAIEDDPEALSAYRHKFGYFKRMAMLADADPAYFTNARKQFRTGAETIEALGLIRPSRAKYTASGVRKGGKKKTLDAVALSDENAKALGF